MEELLGTQQEYIEHLCRFQGPGRPAVFITGLLLLRSFFTSACSLRDALNNMKSNIVS
jgi:hypothetical protein